MTATKQDVPDYHRTGLKLVIVGINPGRRSGDCGHHYAWPGNHFWPSLFEAGLIPEKITFADDRRVLEWDIGLTNLVHEAKSPGPMIKARDRSRQLCKAGAMLRTRAGTSLPLLEGLSRSQNSNGDTKIPTGMPRVEPAC